MKKQITKVRSLLWCRNPHKKLDLHRKQPFVIFFQMFQVCMRKFAAEDYFTNKKDLYPIVPNRAIEHFEIRQLTLTIFIFIF